MKAVLLILAAPTVLAAWPPGFVRRHFHETPKGALHYVVRGDVSKTAPFVFFHGHPRSSEMFKDFAQALPASQPFIAIDYFGAGSSDECLCNETADEFVTAQQFTTWSLEICRAAGASKIVPFGAANGAPFAWELADRASELGLADRLVLFEGYYLKPQARQYIDNVYIPSIRHIPEFQNGSQVLKAWFNPDVGPIGPSSTVPAVEDLQRNQIKTIDWLLAARTGWQYKMAWSAYNDVIVPCLKRLVDRGVKTLFLSAEHADFIADKWGLDHHWSQNHINEVVPESLRQISVVKGGDWGSLEQNATVVVDFVGEFMGWSQGPLVVV